MANFYPDIMNNVTILSPENKKVNRNKFLTYSDNENRQVDDFYATHPSALRNILMPVGGKSPLLTLSKRVWEPCAGAGHLTSVLEEAGHDVFSSDIKKRQIDGFDFRFKDFEVINFMEDNRKWDGDIITNPPFRKVHEFVIHALNKIKDGNKVVILQRGNFLEGACREHLWKGHGFHRFMPAVMRIKIGKDGLFPKGQKSTTMMAWFEFIKGYKGRWYGEHFNFSNPLL